MGLDVKKLLERAVAMQKACGPEVAPAGNPGVHLGAILGTAATQGRDKVTLVMSPSIHRMGAWVEQLLAESTGKNGKALIPVDLEPLGKPEVYGDDRVFVSLAVKDDANAPQEDALAALEKAGHPVVRLRLDDPYDIFGEFFRWEIATAVAGEILHINPFNQPDVEASKIETRKLTTAYETSGKLPPESPLFSESGMSLFTDAENARALNAAAGAKPTLASYLKAHLQRVKPGDYIALLAYVEMNDAHEAELSRTRVALRDAKKVATCLGFGPRFLHSTGQAYKGGPNTDVVLQITCDDAEDLPVPGQRFTFGVVKAAQARGDFAVLAERKRRALRVHLGRDVAAGLKALGAAIAQALKA
jgi:transaldolase/glucose-6-phosphate isomerase